MDAFGAAQNEVVRLHHVIEGWFRGTVPADRFDPDFADALHPDFENIQPSGQVLTRADLLEPIRARHGDNPDFRITIEEPRLLGDWPRLILFGYVEHQTGARASAADNRRRSTVLFEAGPRLIWRHLQETGL